MFLYKLEAPRKRKLNEILDASEESDEAEVFVKGRAKQILPSVENRAEMREAMPKEVANVSGKRANSLNQTTKQ
jgi:hypothetical protein